MKGADPEKEAPDVDSQARLEAARVLSSSLAECTYHCGFAAALAPDAPSQIDVRGQVARALEVILDLSTSEAARGCDALGVAAAVATIRDLLHLVPRDEDHVPAVGRALAELARAIRVHPPFDLMTFVMFVGAVKTGNAGGDLPGLATARPDRLTGLPTRAALCATVDLALAALGRPIWALFLDVDGFQRVNARQGHVVGDDQLAQLGRWIAARVAAIHGSAFRVGGEELVVLFPSSGPAEVGAALNAIVAECTSLCLDYDPEIDGRAFTSLSGVAFLLGALGEAEVPDALEGLRDILHRERLAAGRGYGVAACLDGHLVGRGTSNQGGAI